MPQVVITPVDFEELETLHALAVDTFVEAFGAVNTPENMSTYLSTGMSINQLESELKSLNSKFYFAFYDQILAGYLKLNFYDEPVEGNPANSMEIERIYVKGQLTQFLFYRCFDICFV